MYQTVATTLSHHAQRRVLERQAPAYVVAALSARPFIAQGLGTNGKLSNFRIVRTASNKYWVAIERENVHVTVVQLTSKGQAYSWFKRHILNFRHMYTSIKNMPITRDPAEVEAHRRELEAEEEESEARLKGETAYFMAAFGLDEDMEHHERRSA